MGKKTMSVKYGVRVPFEDQMLWIMEDSGLPFPHNQRVQLFDTRKAAEEAAQIWKTYTVEEYFDNESFDWDNLANNQKA
jgi:hypothetical protein